MNGMNVDDVRRLINRELARFGLMVERVVELRFDETGGAARCADPDVGAEVAGTYGLWSRPPDGVEGWIVRPDGRGQSAILIGTRLRSAEPTLARGEVTLYDDQGQRITVGRGGLTLEGQKVSLNPGNTPKPVVRVGDDIAPLAWIRTWMMQVENFCNTWIPNAVAPLSTAQFAVSDVIGHPSTGSSTVEAG